MPFTLQQRRVLALLPKITGFSSLFFSGLIIWTVLSQERRRKRTYHRILLGISCCDASASFWLALSTWPIPSSSSSAVWAVGNDRTCNVQGFFTQAGISSSFYNASLSVYYLLVVRFNYKEHQLRRVEYWLHGVPLLWACVSASTGLVRQVYGNANLWCWVTAQNESFRWVAFYGPLWVMIGVVTINCLLLWLHVQQVERAAQRHRVWVANSVASDLQASTASQEEQQRENKSSSHEAATASNSSGRRADFVKQAVQSRKRMAAALQSGMTSFRVATRRQRRSSIPFAPEENSPEVQQQQPIQQESRPRPFRTISTDSLALDQMIIGNPQEQRRQEQKQQRRRQKMLNRQSRRTREVANQCFLYAGAFYLNWAALTATRVIQTVDNGKVYYPLLVIAAITVPIQGLPNFLVYLGPKLKRFCKQRMSMWSIWNWWCARPRCCNADGSLPSAMQPNQKSSAQISQQIHGSGVKHGSSWGQNHHSEIQVVDDDDPMQDEDMGAAMFCLDDDDDDYDVDPMMVREDEDMGVTNTAYHSSSSNNVVDCEDYSTHEENKNDDSLVADVDPLEPIRGTKTAPQLLDEDQSLGPSSVVLDCQASAPSVA